MIVLSVFILDGINGIDWMFVLLHRIQEETGEKQFACPVASREKNGTWPADSTGVANYISVVKFIHPDARKESRKQTGVNT